MRPTKKKKLTKENENVVAGDTSKCDHCFKRSEHQKNGFTHQTKIWKNLKSMAGMEKSAQEQGLPTHASLSAPPSTRPVKMYSDLTGLPALYKDPKSKLRYASAKEYQMISHLSPDIVLSLISLRKI